MNKQASHEEKRDGLSADQPQPALARNLPKPERLFGYLRWLGSLALMWLECVLFKGAALMPTGSAKEKLSHNRNILGCVLSTFSSAIMWFVCSLLKHPKSVIAFSVLILCLVGLYK